jgi:hypothetical protein
VVLHHTKSREGIKTGLLNLCIFNGFSGLVKPMILLHNHSFSQYE